eukprot:505388-Prymnesium_polylepis.1
MCTRRMGRPPKGVGMPKTKKKRPLPPAPAAVAPVDVEKPSTLPQPPPEPLPEPEVPPPEPVPANAEPQAVAVPPACRKRGRKRGRPKKGPPTALDLAEKRVKVAVDHLNGQLTIWNKMVERKNNDPGWAWDEPSVVEREKERLARRKAKVNDAKEQVEAARQALTAVSGEQAALEYRVTLNIKNGVIEELSQRCMQLKEENERLRAELEGLRAAEEWEAKREQRELDETLSWVDNYLRGVEPAAHVERRKRVVRFAENAEVREFVVDTPMVSISVA